MYNYSEWLQRAIAFIQSTESLKRYFTEVETQTEFHPPVPESVLQSVIQNLRLPVPDSLKQFWTTATSGCECLYTASNPIGYGMYCTTQIYDYPTSIYSGFYFLNAVELEYHLQNCRDWGEEMEDPQNVRWWLESIPFISIRNGDYIALHTTNNQVIYLSHDDSCFVLASDFGEFLQNWEQLCYVGPESWMLEPFLDLQASKLITSSQKAKDLQSLFQAGDKESATEYSIDLEANRVSLAKQICLCALMFSQDNDRMPSYENWQEELSIYAPDLFSEASSLPSRFAMNKALSCKPLGEVPPSENLVWFYELDSPESQPEKIYITTDSNLHHLADEQAAKLTWSV
jgi:hypothetical protein